MDRIVFKDKELKFGKILKKTVWTPPSSLSIFVHYIFTFLDESDNSKKNIAQKSIERGQGGVQTVINRIVNLTIGPYATIICSDDASI